MNPRIFFIDEHDSSRFNGIGSYLEILLPELFRAVQWEIVKISLNSDVTGLEASERDFGKEYMVPKFTRGGWREKGSVVWPLLRLYISDSPDNVFFFNHSPCADFMRAFKRMFPFSKSVFVIHDQGWCASLYGDRRLLKKIMNHEIPSSVSGKTAEAVLDYCAKELDIYSLSDMVVSLSETTYGILKDIYGVGREKTALIHNGYRKPEQKRLSRSKARKRLGLTAGERLLIFVARSVPHKGIIPLLKAMRIVRKRFPDVRCVLAGRMQGYIDYQDLEKPVASCLIYPGHLDREELGVWYDAADVGVMSSYTEQCSYACLEMMSRGLPIVTSDGNNLSDMLRDRENAFVAHIGNVVDIDSYARRLARKIIEALEATPERMNAMKNNNYRLLRDRYSAEAMARNNITLINNLLYSK